MYSLKKRQKDTENNVKRWTYSRKVQNTKKDFL